MYDDVLSLRFTGDTNAALPARTKVHKIVLINGTTSAVASIKVHDAATVTGNPVAEIHSNLLTTDTYEKYSQSNFQSPLFFERGVSLDITGTSAVGYLYYTR
jgi:3-dehydroquinate dehydratase